MKWNKHYENPNNEIRNPKWFDRLTILSEVEGQYLMTKIQMIQTIGVADIPIMILFLSLGHLIFEFVSNFDIRISDFANARTANHALWA